VPELPDDVDPDLWVEAKGYEGRLFLGWNPHLSPGRGRVGVWAEQLGIGTRISMSDITAAADTSRIWLAGFFVGSEPDPHDMFGPGIRDASPDDPRWPRYWECNRRFRETGIWDAELWVVLTPFAPDALLPPFVFAVRGDEVWLWEDDAWVLADPQPRRTRSLLEGTLCLERGHHDRSEVDPRHVV
jgi:hypothetical protein